MKTINTFGCSWTQGIGTSPSEKDNWVVIAASKTPEYNWLNWARAGSSLLYSTFLAESFNQYKTSNDFVILQITTPGRLTFWEHAIFDKINNPNYFKPRKRKGVSLHNYKESLLDDRYKFGNITQGDIPNGFSIRRQNGTFYRDKPNLAKYYYSAVEREQFFYEWYIQVKHAINYADFVYFHESHPDNRLNYCRFTENIFADIPCFRDELGHDEYSKYQIDEGKHLNTQGNEILADWVLEKIKDKL
jgi:hypothetical protein